MYLEIMWFSYDRVSALVGVPTEKRGFTTLSIKSNEKPENQPR
jgi:hypothetical protein